MLLSVFLKDHDDKTAFTLTRFVNDAGMTKEVDALKGRVTIQRDHNTQDD